jgi:hypothetical protein
MAFGFLLGSFHTQTGMLGCPANIASSWRTTSANAGTSKAAQLAAVTNARERVEKNIVRNMITHAPLQRCLPAFTLGPVR